MKASLQNYLDQWESPWMQLYYRMVWAQVGQLEGQKILDFGSGFGWNANHFAAHNEVVAVEPNLEMVENRQQENTYEQIVGGLSALSAFTDGSFDVILCHNVFEYAPKERLAMLREFTRLISKEGFISIVKHNHAGALMQKIVFENALDEAYALLRGASKVNQMFGKIHYYDIATMLEADGAVSTFKTYGLRTFWALQPNEFKGEAGWADKMFKVEWEVCDKPEFIALSFFNHVLLRKNNDENS
ncbi:class I SAM-dependent methyltransferase [Lactococcus taiwanensis]|uniref:class I SAM-dependent methyltransferase n=1 Tax=Lactococcus taiwanensis TaxID=1151742 RepID=UPI003D0BB202